MAAATATPLVAEDREAEDRQAVALFTARFARRRPTAVTAFRARAADVSSPSIRNVPGLVVDELPYPSWLLRRNSGAAAQRLADERTRRAPRR